MKTLADIVSINLSELQEIRLKYLDWRQSIDSFGHSMAKFLILKKCQEDFLNKLPKLSDIKIDSIHGYNRLDFVHYYFKLDYSDICVNYKPKGVEVSFWQASLKDVVVK